MSQMLTVTEMARRFVECVNRVAARGESFVIVRGRRPVAELRPPRARGRLSQLPALMAALPRLSPAHAASFAADLDAARRDIGNSGIRDPWAS